MCATTSTAGATAVSLRNVTCAYGHTIVLRDVNLELPTGSFTGLVGPSGAGKTTLLRTLTRQILPVRGQVVVNGVAVNSRTAPPGIGYVPQLETVDWDFPVTVAQLVLMGRAGVTHRLPWPSRADHMALGDVLERFGLAHLADAPIRELSGGEQQRMFVARALIGTPRLLILDEPTSGVDIATRNAMLALLHDLNRQGMTIILTTHDLNGVAVRLPSVACINGGLLAYGSPEDVFTPEIVSTTYRAPLDVLRYHGHLLIVERSEVTTLNPLDTSARDTTWT